MEFAYAGDILAGIGLKNTRTGDTLCDPAAPLVLEKLEFPDPVIHVAVEPRSKEDQDKLGKALVSLAEEDPDVPGQGRRRDRPDRHHLGYGRAAPRDARRSDASWFNVHATVGKPQVAYRETITKPTTGIEYVHKKQTGGRASPPSSRWTSSPPAPVVGTSSTTTQRRSHPEE